MCWLFCFCICGGIDFGGVIWVCDWFCGWLNCGGTDFCDGDEGILVGEYGFCSWGFIVLEILGEVMFCWDWEERLGVGGVGGVLKIFLWGERGGVVVRIGLEGFDVDRWNFLVIGLLELLEVVIV